MTLPGYDLSIGGSDGRLPAILSKIKAIAGVDPLEQSFTDRYLLTYDEASIWGRYQQVVWKGLEADFIAEDEVVYRAPAELRGRSIGLAEWKVGF